MLSLQKNIERKQFYKLLDICFGLSSHVTFTKNSWLDVDSDNHISFLNEIKPFYLKTIKTKHWYRMYALAYDTIEVYVYRADEKVKSIIQKYHDNLFFLERALEGSSTGLKYEEKESIIKEYFGESNEVWLEKLKEDGKWGNVKELPENICFFADNKLFLGTVSHENICEVYPFSEDIRKKLYEIGEWEDVDDDVDEQITLDI